MLAAIVKHGLWVKTGKEWESHTPHPLCDSPRSTYRVPGRFWWLSITGTSKAFSDPNYSLLNGSKLSVKSMSRTVLDKWWTGNGAGVSQKEPKKGKFFEMHIWEIQQCVAMCLLMQFTAWSMWKLCHVPIFTCHFDQLLWNWGSRCRVQLMLGPAIWLQQHTVIKKQLLFSLPGPLLMYLFRPLMTSAGHQPESKPLAFQDVLRQFYLSGTEVTFLRHYELGSLQDSILSEKWPREQFPWLLSSPVLSHSPPV